MSDVRAGSGGEDREVASLRSANQPQVQVLSRDASRLALYDAVVGMALAWRACIVPPLEFETDAERAEFSAALDTARKVVQRAGKHIVDGQVIRELAAIHARATEPMAGASVLAVDPASGTRADSRSTPQAVATPALTPCASLAGDHPGDVDR